MGNVKADAELWQVTVSTWFQLPKSRWQEKGAVAGEINRQQQSRVSLIIVNAIGER